MPFLIDKETGEEKYFLDREAAAMLQMGTHSPSEGERLSIVDEFGNYQNVDADSYVSYHSQIGSTPAPVETTEAVREKYRLEEEYDTLGQEIITGLEGAARGVTFGLSDVALTGLGISDTEAMRHRREINPTLATASEIAGVLAPTLLTGGAAGAARLGVGGVRAGRAARTAKGILSYTPAGMTARAAANIAAKGTGKGLIAKTAAGVAAGTLEGTLYGTGQGISELALSDEELSAERIVSTIGSSALTGAKWGAAVGGVLPVAAAVGGVAKKAATKIADELPEAVKSIMPKSLKETESRLVGIKNSLRKETDQVDVLLQQAKFDLWEQMDLLSRTATSTEMARKQINNIDKALKNLADQETIYRNTFSPAGTKGYSTSNVVDDLMTADAKTLNKNIKVINNYHEAGEKVLNLLDEVKTAPMGGVDIMAQAGMPAKVPRSIKEAVEEIKGTRAATTESSDVSKAFDYLAYAELAGITDIQDIPYINKIPGMDYIIMGRLAYRHLNKMQTKAMYKRLASTGTSNASTARMAGYASEAVDKVTKGVSSALKAGIKTAKTTGKIARAAAIPAPLAVFNSTTLLPTEKKQYSAKSARKAFERRAKEIQTLQNAPEMVKQKIAGSVGVITPGILSQLHQVQMRKIRFLGNKLPQDPSGARIIAKPWSPSNSQLKTFSRYFRAAEQPLTLLEDWKNGTLSQEAVEAVAAIYPRLYLDIQQQIVEQIPELRADLTYKSRLQLSRLFQVAVDESMEPGFIVAMQEGYGEQKEEAKSTKTLDVPEMTGPTPDKLTSSKPGEF